MPTVEFNPPEAEPKRRKRNKPVLTIESREGVNQEVANDHEDTEEEEEFHEAPEAEDDEQIVRYG